MIAASLPQVGVSPNDTVESLNRRICKLEALNDALEKELVEKTEIAEELEEEHAMLVIAAADDREELIAEMQAQTDAY